MQENHHEKPLEQRLESATVRRLAALGTMPVDLARLKQAVEKQVPRPHQRSSAWRGTWAFPLRAAAASLLVMGLIAGVIVALSSGPALASTDRLLAVHQAVISGQDHAIPVQSIEGANSALSQHWPKAPGLPAVKHDEVMSCCVHRVGRQNVSCAALKIDGVAVSMAVADAADIRMPEGQRIDRNGITYHIQRADGVNMAMTVRNGRWACLMGSLSVDRLIQALETSQW